LRCFWVYLRFCFSYRIGTDLQQTVYFGQFQYLFHAAKLVISYKSLGEKSVTLTFVGVKMFVFATCIVENMYLCSHETNETMDAGHHPYNVWPDDAQFVFE